MDKYDGVRVEGAFNAQLFFETLAKILSNKYGCEITATAKELGNKGA